jgi:conjugal transfer mating pair stabilization protein TraN
VGDNVCPLGNYSCIDNGNGHNQCSPNQCIDITVPENQIITKVDDTMLQDDGPKDAQGNCLGEIYIFTGRGVRCRGSGVKTSFVNCCSQGDTVVKDSIGSAFNLYGGMSTVYTMYQMGQIAFYSSQLASGLSMQFVTAGMFETGAGSTVTSAVATVGAAIDGGTAAAEGIAAGFSQYATATFLNPTTIAISAAIYLVQELLFSGGCDQQDLETSMMSSSGRCHYVGSYCETEWPFIGCVQRAKGYCCFNSKLARIIHEQGRLQLENFKHNLWGTGEGPSCRGFTTAEFQMLDFSKIDLSEYFGEIQTRAQSEIVGKAQEKIQDFYNKTQ